MRSFAPVRTQGEKPKPASRAREQNVAKPGHVATEAEDLASSPSRLEYDFNRIAIHPPVATTATNQTRLGITHNEGTHEQEAQRTAGQVMATSAQNTAGGTPPRIQSLASRPAWRTVAPPSVYDALARSGSPLGPAVRRNMERRFGRDFSHVRVHSGETAEQSAKDVNAHAYTLGHDIVFGAGQFAPGTTGGQRLLAHELTHVVQQSGVTGLQRQPAGPSRTGRILSLKEIEADPKRKQARKLTGQTTAKVCRSLSAGAGKGNCPATLQPGLQVTIVAEKAGGAWLQILTPEQLPGFGPKEPVYVMAAFVEEVTPAAAQTPRSSGPVLKDILRLDQTEPIKGLAKNQPNYVDYTIARLESAPLGPDITLFPKTGAASQTGISIPKGDFFMDADPLSGFSLGQNQVYKSRPIAEAVVTDLIKQTPDIPVYAYYLQDGVIFPTTLSDTTIPNLMPFIRKKREQDLADVKATADLAEAVAWWYVGARFPIKIGKGGAPAGTAGKETVKQVEKEAAKQAEKEAAKQAEKEAAKQTEKEAGKQAAKKVPAVQPSAPAGWKGTLNAFGKEIGWPRAGKINVPAATADLAKLRNAGVTEQWAVQQAKIYREVARLNPKNPTATLRAEWLEAIAARLRGAP